MPRYQSKAVEIDAFRFGHEPSPDWFYLAEKVGHVSVIDRAAAKLSMQADIKTLEGTMTANYGDWIIRGLEGELYPCKPSVFDRKYKLA